MPKWVKWALWSLLFITIVGGVSATVLLGYVGPHRLAENTMEPGQLTLYAQPDGIVSLNWPQGVNCGGYEVHVLDEMGNSLYDADVGAANSCILPKIEGEVTLWISSYQYYQYLFPADQRIREGEENLEVKMNLAKPQVTGISTHADPDSDTVQADFYLAPTTTARLYHVTENGEKKLLQELNQSSILLNFGKYGDFPLPEYGESVEFLFDAYVQTESYVYYGLPSGSFSVIREDLLGTALNVEHEDLGNNVFALTWDETKGDGYEVQQFDNILGDWITLAEIPKDGERYFETNHLPRYSDFTFRVVARHGEVEPEEVKVHTGASVVYSTIWPIKNLDVYLEPRLGESFGLAKAGSMLCVLDVQGDWFYVRVGNIYGYIDSRYCLINLPEMIGDICLYDITNSYSSLYMVHEFEIPEVTDTVIKGYEKVEMKNGTYLVPLLYPVAQKLEKAAFSAMEQGYKLKIYDSYRPNEATLDIYDRSGKVMELPIPEKPFTDKVLTDLPVLGEGEILTYRALMTDNDRYALANFLAKGGSRHNQGVALDLTLCKNGKDLQMQTSIHDLSWYSESKANNKSAKLLKSIMEGAGFGGLTSEWWHYQDNEAKAELEPPYMAKGVSAQGWVADDTGWRYRKADGTCYKGCEKTIDGVTYQFNAQGYVVEM